MAAVLVPSVWTMLALVLRPVRVVVASAVAVVAAVVAVVVSAAVVAVVVVVTVAVVVAAVVVAVASAVAVEVSPAPRSPLIKEYACGDTSVGFSRRFYLPVGLGLSVGYHFDTSWLFPFPRDLVGFEKTIASVPSGSLAV